MSTLSAWPETPARHLCRSISVSLSPAMTTAQSVPSVLSQQHWSNRHLRDLMTLRVRILAAILRAIVTRANSGRSPRASNSE